MRDEIMRFGRPQTKASSAAPAARYFILGFLSRPNTLRDTEYLQQADAHLQAIDGTAIEKKGGGLLGVESVLEVVVGVSDAGRAGNAWGRFLNPITPDETGVYRLGCGPALRLVPDAKPRIRTMVLKVASLDRARATAADAGPRARFAGGRVTLTLPRTQGVTPQLLQDV